MKNYKKGNVYLVNLNNSYPNIQNGRRPCIIVQNDYANTFSKTLIVVPITTKIKRTDLPINVRIDSKQMALCEHILTISKEQIICYQYTLNRSTIKDIDEAISISLSLKEEK